MVWRVVMGVYLLKLLLRAIPSPPPPNMPIRLLRYFIKMASRNCKVTIPQHGYWQPKQIEAQKTKY